MSEHPLADFSAHVRNFKCFGPSAEGWQRFEPINIIIGRNNSGKSSLIDLINLAVTRTQSLDAARQGRPNQPFELIVSETLDESVLRQVFREGVSGGELGGSHWGFGQNLIGSRAVRTLLSQKKIDLNRILSPEEKDFDVPPRFKQELGERMGWKFGDLTLVRVSAERDIGPESRTTALDITSNGAGVTNVIRAFINSDQLPTTEVTE